jgi:hypothetical protein
MPAKLKRDKSTKENRDFWAGVEKAAEEYRKLPKWQRELMERRYEEMRENWDQTPTCRHCGQEVKGRCRACYG